MSGLHDVIVAELPEAVYVEKVDALVAQYRRDGVSSVLPLVEALGPFLTGEDDSQRARAITLLAEVVGALPAASSSASEVRHLSQFFTSRLTDWPAVRGALRGCLALLSRRLAAGSATHPAAGAGAGGQQPPYQSQQQQADNDSAAASLSASPTDDLVVEMMRTCVSHVFVQALAQQDRQLVLRLLAAAIRGYGPALAASALDLLEYLISSVDGEKDPRCLLLSFDAIQALLNLYHQQPQDSLCHERLEEGSEELFEVLACYFPVTFTPPPNDPNRISRQDIASGLEATLAAEPLFAPHLLPLAMEKLSSTLRQAKLDSLSLLGACASSWGTAPLASHVSTIWAALRAELAAPAAEGLLAADQAAADELAAAAAACLGRCVASFQQGDGASGTTAGASLADAVLADPSMQDMLACIQAPGQDAATHRRSVLRAKAGARAAQALCRAGGNAASKALSQLLPPLLTAAGGESSLQVQCLAWAAIVDLLEAAAAAAAVPAATPAALSGTVASLIQQAVSDAGVTLAQAAASAAAGMVVSGEGGADAQADQEESEEDERGGGGVVPEAQRWPVLPAGCSQQLAASLQLAALAAVCEDSSMSAMVTQQQVQKAVDSVLQLLTGASGGSGWKSQVQGAVGVLRALAGSCHSSVIRDSTLPQLVAAAGQPQSAAAALAALQALAASSAGLQLDILLALDQAIQQQLPAAAAAANNGSSSTLVLLLQLLQAATRIVSSACTAQDSWLQPTTAEAGAAASASFLPLAQHVLDAALLLPKEAASGAAPALQARCADLAYHAMCSAPAEQQVPLAVSAVEALNEGVAGVQAAVCCALLVPLNPDAVAALAGKQDPRTLVQQLVQLALSQSQQDSQQEGGAVGSWASLAAAALLNKWAGDTASLEACSSALLQQQLYPACSLQAAEAGSPAGLPAASSTAWGCLAAISRGLAMRGSREADAVASAVLACLEATAVHWTQTVAGEAGDQRAAAGAKAAACFLGSMLDSGSTAGTGGLGKQSHATVRPLWQQRLYTAVSSQLLGLLQKSLQAAVTHASTSGIASGNTAGQVQHQSQLQPHQPQPQRPLASPVLLLALGHLLQAAPASVLRQDQQRMLPWLLQCLEGLQQGPLADGQLLLALLLQLSVALMSSTGKQQAESELLPQLVPALLGLAQYRPLPSVRETALQCLLLLVELPYTALHPYRRQVAGSLSAAVDDNRRAVRLQAARCRQAWSAA